MMTTPCYGCEQRTCGCHSKCERYMEYKDERERAKKVKDVDAVYLGYAKYRSERIKDRFEKARGENRHG